ncbi:MFS transporter [Candidatus Saccharibacteria bacterium 49-20]|nr:MAG: MFS transporter [Candidatus Saccharibacteria bacterium 49-20]
MKHFIQVLVNTLIANVTTSFLWFALTFWAYLETRSVLATAVVGGVYMLFVAISSLFFGTLVDQHRKKNIMLASAVFTLATYFIAAIVYFAFGANSIADLTNPVFWIFASVVLVGSVVENMRNIALSTTVTILVPKEKHANANGLVGSVAGVGFLVTSVFSGLAIGFLGMGWTLIIALVLTLVATLHLIFFVSIPEEEIVHNPELANKKIDIKGSIAAIHAVPGLFALILFSTFNNFIGGVYMALMDPYGLTLFPVQVWGVVLGITSTGFIIGGLIIAKKGLGKKPLETLLIANIVMAILGMLFTIREFWLLYAVGIFLYMCLIPIIEATEQTIIQRVVPLKRQGRVFGFAASIETAAAPLTALAIGPIAEFWIIPYMNSTQGEAQWSWLLGTGDARGIALLFLISGFIMLMVALLAFTTKSYRILSKFYAKS